jgi:hypothetical protein
MFMRILSAVVIFGFDGFYISVSVAVQNLLNIFLTM